MKSIGTVDLTGKDEVYDMLVNVRWLPPFTLPTSHLAFPQAYSEAGRKETSFQH